MSNNPYLLIILILLFCGCPQSGNNSNNSCCCPLVFALVGLMCCNGGCGCNNFNSNVQ